MEWITFIRANARWLLAGALLTFSSSYGQTFFISIFAGQIRNDFGLSHGDWGLIYTIGTLCSAVVMIWTGALTDIFRVRGLAPVVLLGLAIACTIMAIGRGATVLVLAIFLLRLTGQGMTSHIATVAMARWFVAMRGRAISIATLGYSIGEACLPIIFVAAMAYVSWQGLWIVAALMALAAIPILLLLLREERTPQAIAAENEAAGMDGRHWPRADVLRTGLFWAMCPTVLGPSAFVTAFFFQQVHFAETKGWEHIELVALFPVFTVAGILSMLASGWAIDRFGTTRIMPFFQLPIATAFLWLAVTDSLWASAPAIALMGVTAGFNSTLPAAFWAEFFGSRHLGSIKALATAIMVLGSAIGPGVSGILIDAGFTFQDQMPAISIWFLVASALITPVVLTASKRLTASA